MMITVYPQGTYALEINITVMRLIFRFLVQDVTQAKRMPIPYTDNHHRTRTSKSQHSSLLKSKNCLAFFSIQMLLFFFPSHFKFLSHFTGISGSCFFSISEQSIHKHFKRQKSNSVANLFFASIHVHHHQDLRDGASQPKSAGLPKNTFDSITTEMLSFSFRHSCLIIAR